MSFPSTTAVLVVVLVDLLTTGSLTPVTLPVKLIVKLPGLIPSLSLSSSHTLVTVISLVSTFLMFITLSVYKYVISLSASTVTSFNEPSSFT